MHRKLVDGEPEINTRQLRPRKPVNYNGNREKMDESLLINKRQLRPSKAVNYKECKEKKYLCCEECENRFPHFGPLKKVPDDDSGELGCPPQLEVRPSGIPGAGYGVWTVVPLPPGTCFGPYGGKISDVPDPQSEYVWEVRQIGHVHYVDGRDLATSNWMRYINSSLHIRQQNLQAYQQNGKIYYRTVDVIPENTELLVYYGPEFVKYILNKYHSSLPNTSPLQGRPPPVSPKYSPQQPSSSTRAGKLQGNDWTVRIPTKHKIIKKIKIKHIKKFKVRTPDLRGKLAKALRKLQRYERRNIGRYERYGGER